MAVMRPSAKRPAVSLIDPHNVQEVFANNVIMRIRDGVVHLTLCAARPCGADEKGAVVDEHVVTARAVMSVPTLLSMFQSFQQIQRNQESQENKPLHQQQPANIH
jgi:hypothetical protein